jgi:hypothetical protein
MLYIAISWELSVNKEIVLRGRENTTVIIPKDFVSIYRFKDKEIEKHEYKFTNEYDDEGREVFRYIGSVPRQPNLGE